MSDTQAPVEDTTETPFEDSGETVEDGIVEDDAGNAEAARWRRKLRDAEGERDALAQRLEAVQRQSVEGLLTASGVKAQAVFAVAELADLLGEDGSIDTDKVGQAVEAAREKFGIAKPTKGNLIPGVGHQPSQMPKLDAWKDAFTPPRKR